MRIEITPALKAKGIFSGTAFPPNPAEGDCFYRTDLDEFYIFDGTNWILPTPAAHAPTHVLGGIDEINTPLNALAIALANQGDIVFHAAAANTLAALAPGVAGQALLTGGPGADPFWAAPAPAAHAATHEPGGVDEVNDIDILNTGVLLSAHAARHEPGGADEVNDIDILNTGVLLSAHEARHVLGGADDIDSPLNALAIALTTHGDIVYHAAAANTLARLAPGVAGQALLTGGPGANPYWGAGVGVDTRGRTIVVAASNSIDVTLAPAAYRCDGTNDQVEINAAITALGATGGTVILLEGTYAITASINLATLTALMGQGAGTVLRIPNAFNADLNVISAVSVNRVIVADLRIDGNKANQAAGVMNGIYFDTVTYSTIARCWVENLYGVLGVDSAGVLLSTSSDNNTVTDNNCLNNGGHGIALYVSSNNTVTGNTVVGNSQAADNTYDGIEVDILSDYNNVQGNTVRHAGGANQHLYGIGIAPFLACNGNLVIGNDMYLAGRTADYFNAGIGTIYHNNRTTAGYSDDWLNQAVLTTSNPIFNNLTLTGWAWIQGRNYLFANPADPATPGSGMYTYKMMGLGSVLTITPQFSGTLKIEASMGCRHTTANTGIVQLCYGTGAAPANQAAATGTTFGPALERSVIVYTGTNPRSDFTWVWVLTGLTVGTPYWFDGQMKEGLGGDGKVSFHDIMWYMEEI